MVKIVVSGAAGRMGGRIIALAKEDPEVKVVSGVELKSDTGSNIVASLADVKDAYDCVIEFTAPEPTVEHVQTAQKLKKAMVVFRMPMANTISPVCFRQFLNRFCSGIKSFSL